MAKRSRLLPDGRRRIVDFLSTGDFFGFFLRTERQLCVEATVNTVLARYPRQALEELADSAPKVNRQLRELALGSVCRLQARILLLGRGTALERVSAFLLEMQGRSRIRGGATALLPMSRYDIADYLALSVETVSRTLTMLRQNGTIEMPSKRCVIIINRSTLETGSY